MNAELPVPTRARASEPLRVVHVITRLLRGGAEENTIASCLHQACCGWRVTLVHGGEHHPSWSARLGGEVELVSLPFLVQPIAPWRDLRAAARLARLLARIRPDVVHTHQSKAGIVGRLAAAAARVPTVVHTIHIAPFLNVTPARAAFFTLAERLCAAVTDRFIAVSEGMRDAFVDKGICRAGDIEVIHSGMKLDDFMSARAPSDWRDRIGGWRGAERPKIVLMLASFEPRKRQRELLQAIAPSLSARPDICLILAGEGAERAKCEALADALGLSEQVRFPGHDPKPHELIALADLCLLTSEREGLPRSAVQYIAAGKPVVMPRLPGLDELIEHGTNGIITPLGDLAPTVTQMFELLDDPKLLARLSDGARATDVERWREQRMGERIAQLYLRTRGRRAIRCARRSVIGPFRSIEFFGLPGSGKTAVARALKALLERKGCRTRSSGDIMGDGLAFARRLLRRLWLIVREWPRQPGTAFRSAIRLAAGRSTLKDKAKTVWNYSSVLAMCTRHMRRPEDMLILDQGMAQAVAAQRIHNTGPAQLPAAAELIDSRWLEDCLFVHMVASPELARARLSRRKRRSSRLQRSAGAAADRMWERAREVDGELARELRDELIRHGLHSHFLEIRSHEGSRPERLAELVLDHAERAGPPSSS